MLLACYVYVSNLEPDFLFLKCQNQFGIHCMLMKAIIL